MRPGNVRIGLASPRVAATREDGLAAAERFLAEAAAQGAAIICFPETYLPGYRGLDFAPPPLDQSAQERALQAVSDLARRYRVAAIMPMEWASPAGLLNLAFVVDADGAIQGYQTKNQLAIEEERRMSPARRGASSWSRASRSASPSATRAGATQRLCAGQHGAARASSSIPTFRGAIAAEPYLASGASRPPPISRTP